MPQPAPTPRRRAESRAARARTVEIVEAYARAHRDDRVPLADLCELQRRCAAPATLHVIDSRHGHDAFLKEDAQIGALLHEALADAGSGA